MQARVTPSFFERSPVDCARDLVGARFLWHGCAGRIVETEAYAAEGDPACHTFSRPSARDFVKTHPAGTAYVYLNYGIHWLFNVLVKGPQGAGFVLFRAMEPLAGIELMAARRRSAKPGRWGAGPGNLTRAMGIDGSAHGLRFLDADPTGLFRDPSLSVVSSRRIGISRAQEFPWRFHEAGNVHVSR